MESGADGVGRPVPPEPALDEKLQAVLSVLARRTSHAQEARRHGVSEAEVDCWLRLFVEAGRRGLHMGGRTRQGPPLSLTELRTRNEALTSALRRATGEARSWRRSAHGELGPFNRLEEIRRGSGLPVARFCALVGISRRTYFRRLTLLRSGRLVTARPSAATMMTLCVQVVADYMEEHPKYGYRRIHELMVADGHLVSESTVLRAMRINQRRGAAGHAQWPAADSDPAPEPEPEPPL